MKSDHVVVEWIQHGGQLRPYADTQYHARISYFVENVIRGKVLWDAPQDTFKALARVLVHGWYDELPDPFAPELKKFEKIEPGVYEILVAQRFTD